MKIALPSSKPARVALLVVLGAVLLAGYVLGCTNQSDGYRDGVIQKFSRKRTWGFIKTWEGELALPGYGGSHSRGGSGQGAATWEFSVADTPITDEIKAMPPDAYVRLYYYQVYIGAPWKGATDYRVYKVERVVGN